eukprot:1194364-Prorocentrum_minimum.AAC.8
MYGRFGIFQSRDADWLTNVRQVVDREVGRVAEKRQLHPLVAVLYRRALSSGWALSGDQRGAVAASLALLEADLSHTEAACRAINGAAMRTSTAAGEELDFDGSGDASMLECEVGLHTAIKSLLSHLITGEFNSPTNYLRTPLPGRAPHDR